MTDDRVSMYSGGAASWAATRRDVERHGLGGLTLLHTDVLGEDQDNYRFLVESAADVFDVQLPAGWQELVPTDTVRGSDDVKALRELAAEYLPRLVWLAEGRTIWDVFRDRRFLGNSRITNCSELLKQKPARAWLDAHRDPATTTVLLGIDWTEIHRMAAIERSYLPYRAAAPLCEAPYLSRDDVFAQLDARGLRRPRLYDLGMQHANCGGGCVRAGAGQFIRLLETMPDRFAEWEGNEQSMRDYLDKPVTIVRDGRKRPVTLRQIREQVESRPTLFDTRDLFDLDRDDVGGCGCLPTPQETP